MRSVPEETRTMNGFREKPVVWHQIRTETDSS